MSDFQEPPPDSSRLNAKVALALFPTWQADSLSHDYPPSRGHHPAATVETQRHASVVAVDPGGVDQSMSRCLILSSM